MQGVESPYQGFGTVCYVLSGLAFGQAGVGLNPLLERFLEGETETFKTEGEALRRVQQIARGIPQAVLTLQDRPAQLERMRVWRVG